MDEFSFDEGHRPHVALPTTLGALVALATEDLPPTFLPSEKSRPTLGAAMGQMLLNSVAPMKRISDANDARRRNARDANSAREGSDARPSHTETTTPTSSLLAAAVVPTLPRWQKEKRPRTRWTRDETEALFDGIHQVGLDAGTLQLFVQSKTRREVVARLRRERELGPDRLADALKNRKPLDMDRIRKGVEERRSSAPAAPLSAVEQELLQEMENDVPSITVVGVHHEHFIRPTNPALPEEREPTTTLRVAELSSTLPEALPSRAVPPETLPASNTLTTATAGRMVPNSREVRRRGDGGEPLSDVSFSIDGTFIFEDRPRSMGSKERRSEPMRRALSMDSGFDRWDTDVKEDGAEPDAWAMLDDDFE